MSLPFLATHFDAFFDRFPFRQLNHDAGRVAMKVLVRQTVLHDDDILA